MSSVAPATSGGKSVSRPATAAAPKTTSIPKPKTVDAAPKKQPAARIDDDFWEEGLKPDPKPTPKAKPAVRSAMGVVASASNPVPLTKPAKAKEKKVRWGADWGKVAGGLLALLIAGGINAALFFSVGRINIWLLIVAGGGLFTALSGLMGEEGIW